MLNSVIRFFFRKLGSTKQKSIINFLSYIPLINKLTPIASHKWVNDSYSPFARKERERIYLSIARFAHINRPIEGYYFEFGCHEANTMRMAWNNFHHLFDWTYVAFDSFEGLPEMEQYDSSTIFTPGNLATSESEFIQRVTGNGMPRDRLITVKGFYSDSLTSSLNKQLSPKKAAVIYIDCDLYKSTVPVLSFCHSFLQKGTVVVFDDWNCYYGSPDYGERRAWAEYLKENPGVNFVPFVSTGEAQAFICTDIK